MSSKKSTDLEEVIQTIASGITDGTVILDSSSSSQERLTDVDIQRIVGDIQIPRSAVAADTVEIPLIEDDLIE